MPYTVKYKSNLSRLEKFKLVVKKLRLNIKYGFRLMKNSGIKVFCDVLFFDLKPDKKFDVTLSVTAIVKNEAQYIKEWIEFHKIVGVEKFYIYDNESTDDTKEVLKPYIDSGDVIYKYYPGKAMQMNAYNDSINLNRYKTKYMAFIDLDEFIVPVEKDNVIDVIDELQSKNKKKIAGIGINWLIHGFNGVYDKKQGLLTKLFPKCEYGRLSNYHVKSIVNPRSVIKFYNPHFALHILGAKVINANNDNMFGPYTEPNFDKIRLNHYYTKSYNEYLLRIQKGKADGNKDITELTYNPDFCSIDEDTAIKKYIPKLNVVCQSAELDNNLTMKIGS